MQQAMDNFTRNYSYALALAIFLASIVWLANIDYAAWSLNRQLAEVPAIADYPYRFRVKTIENGVAVVSTPRSFEVPVARFLTVLYPELISKPVDGAEMTAAQATLAEVQKQVKATVLADPTVQRMRWVVDYDWYDRHGIVIAGTR